MSQNATIAGHIIERGFLILGPVNIGKDCVVGLMSAIMPSTSLDNGVALAPMTMVPLGVALPPNTTWEGSPAREKKGSLLAEGPSSGTRFASIAEEAGSFTNVQGESLPHAEVTRKQFTWVLGTAAMTWVAFLPMAFGIVASWYIPLVRLVIGSPCYYNNSFNRRMSLLICRLGRSLLPLLLVLALCWHKCCT